MKRNTYRNIEEQKYCAEWLSVKQVACQIKDLGIAITLDNINVLLLL